MAEDEKGTEKLGEEAKKAKEVADELVKLRQKLDEAAKAGIGFDAMIPDIQAVKEALFGLSEQYKKTSEAVYQNSRSLKDMSTARKFHSNLLADEVKQRTGYLEITNRLIRMKREELAVLDENSAKAKEIQEELDKLTQLHTEEAEALEQAEIRQEGYNNISKSAFSTIRALTGVTEEWRTTLVGSIISSGSLTKGMDALVAQMQKQLTLSNMVGSTLMKVQEMTISMAKADDAAAVSLMTYNNMSKDQVDSTLDMARSNRALGFSQKEVAQNFRALQEVSVGFSGLTQGQKEELAKLNSTMERFGVGANEAAQSAALLMDTLNMSQEQVSAFQMELANFGKSIGKNLSELNRELVQAGPVIITYGNQGTDVFKKLSATAKGLKMDIEQMTGAFEATFNTFESTYEHVGKLNSILAAEGRMIDANAVLMGDAADVAQIFASNLQGTSLQYKALNGPMAKFYQMQIANAMGTSDMSVVMKVLNGDLAKVGDNLSYAARGYEEFMKSDFLESAENQQEMTHKLRMAMEQFGIAVMPVVRGITYLLTGFNKLMDAGDGLGKVFVITLGILGTLMGLKLGYILLMGKLAIAKAAMAGASAAEAAANVPATTSNYAYAASMKAKAAAAKASLFSMLALGAAVALIGAGVGAAALGISKLAESLKGADAGQIIGLGVALGILGFAMVKLTTLMLAASPAALAAAPAFLALGAAIFLIGAGIGVAAMGMAMLMESFKGMNFETAAAILAIAGGLAILALVMGKVAAVALIAGIGMALAFGMMSLFVASISGEEEIRALEGLNGVLKSIAEMDFSNVRSNISEVSAAVGDMVGKISDMDDASIVRVESLFGAINGTAPAGAATPMSVPAAAGRTSADAPMSVPGGASAQVDMSKITEKISELLIKMDKLASRPVELTMDYKNTKAVAKIVGEFIDERA